MLVDCGAFPALAVPDKRRLQPMSVIERESSQVVHAPTLAQTDALVSMTLTDGRSGMPQQSMHDTIPPVMAAMAWCQVISRATLADISGCGIKALAWTVYGKVWRTPLEPLQAVRTAGAPPRADATAAGDSRAVCTGVWRTADGG